MSDVELNSHPNLEDQKSNAQIRLVIIGAGPGGYAAAIRASQLGASVTLIDREKVGGTCLNWGCIPSKIMRKAADLADAANATHARNEAAIFGINSHALHNSNKLGQAAEIDLAVLRARQTSVISAQASGLERHFKALGINLLKGEAKLEKRGEVSVTLSDAPNDLATPGSPTISAAPNAPDSTGSTSCPNSKVTSIPYDHLLLAIGSAPASIPGLSFDGEKIISSNQALWMEKLPKSMLVVGGGVIGCELAQIFHSFGVKVTLVEALPRLLPLPSLDEEITKTYARSLKKAKFPFYVGHTVAGLVSTPNGLIAKVQPFSLGQNLAEECASGEKKSIELEVEQILVATGRKSIAASLHPQGLDGLRTLGLGVDAKGWIEADSNFRTQAGNIWAIGDCLGPTKVMLAHVATAEGLAAVENMLAPESQNKSDLKTINYHQVPSAIFTAPEIASAGLSLAQAQAEKQESQAHDFLFRQLGKAQAMNETDGLIRLVCAPCGTILGGQLIGPCATSLIGEISLAVQQGLKAEDLANTIHAHPTLPEGIWEAALSACGKPLHGS